MKNPGNSFTHRLSQSTLIGIKTTVDRRKPIHCKLDLAEINNFEERYDHINDLVGGAE